MKLIAKIFLILAISLISLSCVNSKALVQTNKPNNVVVGATLNYHELSTIKKQLFLKDFTYLTPSNSAKQSRVHPKPTVWEWGQIDEFIAFSKKHNLQVRLHGPISPQASKWAKEDFRTPKELETNMIEFATAFAKKFNNEPTVKWMDVVNETVLPSGKWFGPKKGTDKWENPWLKIGLDEKGFPLYILKSFEIATKYATNIKLVYNQNGGVQPKLWNKVKETILYIRSKGFRVDGIGWQAHIGLSSSTKALVENSDEALKKLANLIDWAHENDLDFHVTEIDYRLVGSSPTSSDFNRQAQGYANIIKTLISKRSNGVVTFSTWGVYDKNQISDHEFKYMYDSKLNPKKAVEELKKALKNKSTSPNYLD